MIKRFCEQCGGVFEASPQDVKKGYGKFCSRKCYHEKHRAKQICKYCGKEFKAKLSVIKSGRRKFCSRKCKDKWQSENQIEKNSPNYKPEKHKWIEKNRGKHFCQCGCGQSIKILPEHYSRGIPSFIHPHNRKAEPNHHTKPELIFEEICKDNNLPFHYAGDGSLWVGKKGGRQLNPDFIEANGKKICVEIMGAYWHSPLLLNQNLRETSLLSYRRRHYKKYKWQSIFIWDTDLIRGDAEQFVLNILGKYQL